MLGAVGADNRQVRTGPLLEVSVAALVGLIFGIPIGIGLAVVAVRVLGLFFALPPPVATIPALQLLALALAVVVMSAIAAGIALRRITTADAGPVLREP